jgi:hypothetical protein
MYQGVTRYGTVMYLTKNVGILVVKIAAKSHTDCVVSGKKKKNPASLNISTDVKYLFAFLLYAGTRK